MSQTFVWNTDFEVGIPSVDGQHKHLVALVNRLSSQLLTGNLDEGQRRDYLRELTDYTHYHFQEEHMLMEAAGLDAGFILRHKYTHQQFMEQVLLFSGAVVNSPQRYMEALLKYLYGWLVFHILGMDHRMGEQIDLVGKGIDPAEAAKQARTNDHDTQLEPLLGAFSSLFDLLAEKNRDLQEMNATLEAHVAERTEQLRNVNAMLANISMTDALTTLPNRRHARERLQQLWDQNDNAPFSCLMIDADYFKEVNDHYGHAAGDKVLKALALALQHEVRSDDFIARLGGDEFCVLCQGTALQGAQVLAAHLLEIVARLRIETGNGSHWRSSVSIGVACRTPAMQSPDELIKLADESLYLAKASGRSCARSLQTGKEAVKS